MSSSSSSVVSIAVLLLHCSTVCQAINFDGNAYSDIVIDMQESLPSLMCTEILQNLEETIVSASVHLKTALDDRAYFSSVAVNLPATWPDTCVPNSNEASELPPLPKLPKVHKPIVFPNINQPSKSQEQQLKYNPFDILMKRRLVTSRPSPSTGGKSDITITASSPLFGDTMWTQQSGGCGVQGDQIYIPIQSLEKPFSGKEFVKQWAKYRYGIFDEIGFFEDPIYPRCYFTDTMHVTGCSDGPIKDTSICHSSSPLVDMTKSVSKNSSASLMFVPHADNVRMFCNNSNHNRYAPTKHNLLCNRRSTLDVIMEHPDFSDEHQQRDQNMHGGVAPNTRPLFSYKRRLVTRYMLVIDETQDILIRESWNFLRSAIRKWVVYDLQSNTEIGIVLASGQSTSDKVLGLTNLNLQQNRDLVASFVPYAPSDSREVPCISCAVERAISMLERQRDMMGPASHVVVVIAPGMHADTKSVSLAGSAGRAIIPVRIATINYPDIVRRKPLDELAKLTDGMAFTVMESKFNSEKSFLQTYFQLVEALSYIGNQYYEGPGYHTAVEIHRKRLVDYVSDDPTKRASRMVRGNFYMDDSLIRGGAASGFFIYTHSAETPLIQNVRLTSPAGAVYQTRSDQRMPVKQLTLVANINETGTWTYAVERFNGNPQPHFVQVLATSMTEEAPTIRARAWVVRSQITEPFILYCEMKRGNLPIRDAKVRAIVTRPADNGLNCPAGNATECELEYELLDTGAGDPDITKGDGIYTRYVPSATVAGAYTFEFFANDNGNTASSVVASTNTEQLLPCCGSEMAAPSFEEMAAALTMDDEIVHNPGSFVPVYFTRKTAPFERYFPMITIHVNAGELSASGDVGPQIIPRPPRGRIGDLTMNYVPENKLRMRWTSPDMGGKPVVRYEIKYAFTVQDIVDRYDTAAIMWSHDTPYPSSTGRSETFDINIDLEPQLYGQGVFFAIRPFDKLTSTATGGPISNIVRTFIPIKQNHEQQGQGQSFSTNHHNTHNANGSLEIWFGKSPSNKNHTINGISNNNVNVSVDGGSVSEGNATGTNGTRDDDPSTGRLMVAFPMVAVIFIVVGVIIYICFCQGNRQRKLRQSQKYMRRVVEYEQPPRIRNPMVPRPATSGGDGGMGGSDSIKNSSSTNSPDDQQNHKDSNQLKNNPPPHQQQRNVHRSDSSTTIGRDSCANDQPFATTTATIVHNYSTLDIVPDHHTVGIPIYNNDVDIQHKRLSGSAPFGNGLEEAIKAHQLQQHPLQQQQPKVKREHPFKLWTPGGVISCGISSDEENSIYAGIVRQKNGASVFSTQQPPPAATPSNSDNNGSSTLTRHRQVVSPFEARSASQLLSHRKALSALTSMENDEFVSQFNLILSEVAGNDVDGAADQVSPCGTDEISLNELGASEGVPPVPPLPYAGDLFNQYPLPTGMHMYDSKIMRKDFPASQQLKPPKYGPALRLSPQQLHSNSQQHQQLNNSSTSLVYHHNNKPISKENVTISGDAGGAGGGGGGGGSGGGGGPDKKRRTVTMV